MIFYSHGAEDASLTESDLNNAIRSALAKLGSRESVLIVPPDSTRSHSKAGELTRYAWEYYGDKVKAILPALGTHVPMSADQIKGMFGDVPQHLFREHDWKNNLITLGEVPAEFVSEISGGDLDYSWPAQVNELLRDGGHDLILSIGQVVPHEVAGMANYNKNIFIGTGGSEGINKSHFLGAVFGMEHLMGRADTPVRKLLNYASDNFCADLPQIVYVLTVIAPENGAMVVKGVFIGDDIECFNLASELSLKVNFQLLDKPLDKVVVYLDPQEFKSTWLGNKAIYRTRMAIADGGELIVLAPGVERFGEDAEIDRLIRKHGYCGTPETLRNVKNNEELRNSLSAAAHLIHGSSEGRFSITYCPGDLTREEIESVNFQYRELDKTLEQYNPDKLEQGFNNVGGEEVFYISNPAAGLWAWKQNFSEEDN
jgi:nickel-dependent lactate racemase